MKIKWVISKNHLAWLVNINACQGCASLIEIKFYEIFPLIPSYSDQPLSQILFFSFFVGRAALLKTRWEFHIFEYS